MQTSQHQLQQLQQQRANAMQAAGRMTAGRHASFEMGQSSQGWGFGSGMSGMNQSRPPMSGYPSMMQSYQQQQQQQQQDALDMSDFPALGGSGSNVVQNPTISAASYASTAGTGSSGLNNGSSSNGGLSQEFSIEDDFPALPGARSSNSSRGGYGQQPLTPQQQQLHHHRSQQQHQQDGMGSFSPMGNPVTGSQLQIQQQLAGDLMFQQRQSLAQQQMLQRQMMGHIGAGQGSSQLNGSSPQLSMNAANSPSDMSKMAKSYAMKASNSPSLHASTPAGTVSQAPGSKAVGSTAGAPGMTIASTSPSGTGGSVQAPGSQQQAQQIQGAGATQQQLPQPPMSDVDRFGLYGMLGVIRMTDQDMMTLALGSDLTTLGLSLNSPDPLYGSFVSPWFESPLPSGADIDFQVPSCYNVQPPPPAQAKMSSLLDETLFYIFYSMPRDVLQDAAAVELYNRHWRYHKELRLWLTKDQTSEHSKTQTFERGTYIFFDPSSWEKVKKDFIVMYDALEERRQPPPTPLGAMANGGGNGAAGANAVGAAAASANAGGDMPVGSSALGLAASASAAMINGFDGSNAPNMGLLSNLNAGTASTAQHQQLKQQAVNAAH